MKGCKTLLWTAAVWLVWAVCLTSRLLLETAAGACAPEELLSCLRAAMSGWWLLPAALYSGAVLALARCRG